MTPIEAIKERVKELGYDHTLEAFHIIEGLLAVVEMQREALRRYTGRKLEFNEDGGGTLLYNGNEGPKMLFFEGETWEYGSHAEEISELVQATLEKIGKGDV